MIVSKGAHIPSDGGIVPFFTLPEVTAEFLAKLSKRTWSSYEQATKRLEIFV